MRAIAGPSCRRFTSLHTPRLRCRSVRNSSRPSRCRSRHRCHFVALQITPALPQRPPRCCRIVPSLHRTRLRNAYRGKCCCGGSPRASSALSPSADSFRTQSERITACRVLRTLAADPIPSTQHATRLRDRRAPLLPSCPSAALAFSFHGHAAAPYQALPLHSRTTRHSPSLPIRVDSTALRTALRPGTIQRCRDSTSRPRRCSADLSESAIPAPTRRVPGPGISRLPRPYATLHIDTGPSHAFLYTAPLPIRATHRFPVHAHLRCQRLTLLSESRPSLPTLPLQSKAVLSARPLPTPRASSQRTPVHRRPQHHCRSSASQRAAVQLFASPRGPAMTAPHASCRSGASRPYHCWRIPMSRPLQSFTRLGIAARSLLIHVIRASRYCAQPAFAGSPSPTSSLPHQPSLPLRSVSSSDDPPFASLPTSPSGYGATHPTLIVTAATAQHLRFSAYLGFSAAPAPAISRRPVRFLTWRLCRSMPIPHRPTRYRSARRFTRRPVAADPSVADDPSRAETTLTLLR